MAREPTIFENLVELLDDISHLTNIKLDEWKFKWYKQKEYQALDEQNIRDFVPDSPSKYKEFTSQLQGVQQEHGKLNDEISQIKKLSGIG
jgi:hypothetical protein